jgi:hypothetical protein
MEQVGQFQINPLDDPNDPDDPQTFPALNDEIEVHANPDNTFDIFYNGVYRLTVTSTQNSTLNYHGIGFETTTGAISRYGIARLPT